VRAPAGGSFWPGISCAASSSTMAEKHGKQCWMQQPVCMFVVLQQAFLPWRLRCSALACTGFAHINYKNTHPPTPCCPGTSQILKNW
jgi:hypothetical protein